MFLLSWFITKFEPLEIFLDLLPDKLFFNLIKVLFSCLMCVSFWTTLIFTFNIFHACGMAFLSFWYMKYISPIENKVRL